MTSASEYCFHSYTEKETHEIVYGKLFAVTLTMLIGPRVVLRGSREEKETERETAQTRELC